MLKGAVRGYLPVSQNIPAVVLEVFLAREESHACSKGQEVSPGLLRTFNTELQNNLLRSWMDSSINMKHTRVCGVRKRQAQYYEDFDSSLPFCFLWSRKHQFLPALAGTFWIQTSLAVILIHQYLL